MSGAATKNRSRRSTAGKRMKGLVGKALNDDSEFWGHETWAEGEDGSGNESFHESDEDSAQQKDEFDSDFNDSESDNNEEDKEAGVENDKQLKREEARRSLAQKNRGSGTFGGAIVKVGRNFGHKKKKGSKKIAMGDGMNAGLILNIPAAASATIGATLLNPAGSSPVEAVALVKEAAEKNTISEGTSFVSETSSPSPLKHQEKHQIRKRRINSTPDRATSTRTTRSNSSKLTTVSKTIKRRQNPAKRVLRTATKEATVRLDKSLEIKAIKKANQIKKGAGVKKNNNKRLYTQEELIVEAVHETEPESERWLLKRKRNLDSVERSNNAAAAGLYKKNRDDIIQTFHSRRGCLNTIQFLHMDHVPKILIQPKVAATKAGKVNDKMGKKSLCFITGKPARYRDPLTKIPYYNATAFKELRRRYQNGEGLGQIKNSTKTPLMETLSNGEKPISENNSVKVSQTTFISSLKIEPNLPSISSNLPTASKRRAKKIKAPVSASSQILHQQQHHERRVQHQQHHNSISFSKINLEKSPALTSFATKTYTKNIMNNSQASTTSSSIPLIAHPITTKARNISNTKSTMSTTKQNRLPKSNESNTEVTVSKKKQNRVVEYDESDTESSVSTARQNGVLDSNENSVSSNEGLERIDFQSPPSPSPMVEDKNGCSFLKETNVKKHNNRKLASRNNLSEPNIALSSISSRQKNTKRNHEQKNEQHQLQQKQLNEMEDNMNDTIMTTNTEATTITISRKNMTIKSISIIEDDTQLQIEPVINSFMSDPFVKEMEDDDTSISLQQDDKNELSKNSKKKPKKLSRRALRNRRSPRSRQLTPKALDNIVTAFDNG